MGTPVFALTLIEIVGVGIVLLALAGAVIWALGGAGASAIRGKVTITWATAPATVPAGGSATFVLQSSRKRGGTVTPDVGRAFTFDVLAGYLTVTPTTGTTDIGGLISVVVSAPADVPSGVGGTLTATETATGGTERVTFTVQ